MTSNQHAELRDYLNEYCPKFEQKYLELIDKVRTHKEPFEKLQNFSEPGIKHCFNLHHIFYSLIPQTMPEPLSQFELFALFTSALFHEVGIYLPNTSKSFQNEMRLDYFIESRQFILRHREKFGLTNHEAQIIGEICRSQGMPNLEYLSDKTYSLRKHGKIRVSLLSAFLRLADSLDFTDEGISVSLAGGRRYLHQGKKTSNFHRHISNIEITSAPSWDIRIIVLVPPSLDDRIFYELRNSVQNELDTVYSTLRSEELFFKKIELVLNHECVDKSTRSRKNPFLLLAPFMAKDSYLFAGRNSEIQAMIERILGRRLVVLIGESGVGKTSLVEAGVIPQLRDYNYGIIRFSFQANPISSLNEALGVSKEHKTRSHDPLQQIRSYIQQRPKIKKLLIIGDHLEQLFTVKKSDKNKTEFMHQTLRILGSKEPITLLFCMREDYLHELYTLSREIPEFYDAKNTYKLYRLSRENGIEAFKRASQYAAIKIPEPLIERLATDLCYEGNGTIYPPFFQIVGYRLYAALKKNKPEETGLNDVTVGLYSSLGGVKKIVNRYFDGLLDQYSQEDKISVGKILSAMVTEYYTKKRIKKEELQRQLPDCHNLSKLLDRLVNQRIVRRTLGQYELIHDFLARRVIEFIDKRKFVSPPVRKALSFMQQAFANKKLTSATIAKEAGVTQAHLSILFRDQLECTVNKQLNKERISKAKELLLSDRQNLSSIASKCGFKSLSAFSRKFKQIEGTSPLDFRTAYIKKHSERLKQLN